MNAGLTFFKALGALLLWVVLLASFGYYLAANVFKSIIDQPQTIFDSLDRHDAYNRLYEQVLISDDFALAGSIDVAFQMSDEEKRQLLQQIMPPDYTRQEAESVINSVLDYLGDGKGTPEVSLNLKAPISRIKPSVFDFIDHRVEVARSVKVSSQAQFAAEMAEFLTSTAAGIIPGSVPSLEGLSPSAAAQSYRDRIADFDRYGGASSKTLEALKSSEDQVAATLSDGDVKAAIRVAAKAVADPRIDGVVGELRNVLDEQERLDLLGWIAEQIGAPDKARQDARSARMWVELLVGYGAILALLVSIAAAVAIVVVFAPYLWNGLLWMGSGLVLLGSIFLALGIVQSMDLGFWDALWCGGSGCSLMMDVVSSVAAESAGVVIQYSIALIVLGAICVLPAWLAIKRATTVGGRGEMAN